MTGIIPPGIPFALAAATNLLPFVYYRIRAIGPNTRGGGIIPNCTLEETHRDQMVITQHPVEQNAPIADHVYKLPVEVRMRAGWSNSALQSIPSLAKELITNFSPSNLGNTYIDQIYQNLLSLQNNRAPFDLFTGKRQYTNMIMEELTVRTDPHSENILMAEMVCREVIIVSTVTTSANANNMKSPDANADVQNRGNQNLRTSPPTFTLPSFL